jgi:single-strand DNA-binding protein
MDKNYVDVQGNLTKDCELRYSSNGMAICSLSVAVNESKKKPDGTWENIPSYFDVTCFGKLAERVAPAALKGKRFDISGHLKQERWQSTDGKNMSKVVIIADDISPTSLLGSSSGATGGKPAPAMASGFVDDFPDNPPF